MANDYAIHAEKLESLLAVLKTRTLAMIQQTVVKNLACFKSGEEKSEKETNLSSQLKVRPVNSFTA